MSRIPNSRDTRFRRAQRAQEVEAERLRAADTTQQAATDSLAQRVTALETAPPAIPDITGPVLLGRESGTGRPVPIALGTGLSIVGGVLTYTPVTP